MMHIFTISASEHEEFEAWKKEHDAKIRADAIKEFAEAYKNFMNEPGCSIHENCIDGDCIDCFKDEWLKGAEMKHIFTISASEKEEFEAWKKEHDAKIRADAIEECISKLEAIYEYAEKQTKYPQYDHYCNGIEDCIDALEQLKEQK